jgi:hypothetical protein
MSLLLLAAVAVQYNDPDPMRWMAVYGLGAIASGLAAVGRAPTWLAALAFVAFAAWGLTMLPAVFHFRVESVTEMSKGIVVDEEAREGVGLLIGAVWCAFLWRFVHRAARGAGASPSSLEEHST